jgi:hypothetical protein
MASKLKFCRIDLSKTNYCILDYSYAREILLGDRMNYWNDFQQIYKKYCDYKNFASVMPLWISQFQSSEYRIIGYFDDNQKLIAWTKLRQLDYENIESEQFAWDYVNPNLKLGIRSLEYESSYFKIYGFKYLWLGFDDHYKQQIPGFEIVGKL